MKELVALACLGLLALAGAVTGSWLVCFLVLLCAVALAIARDLAPRVCARSARRRMLEGLDDRAYFESVRQVARQWLERPPRMALKDQTRLLILDDLGERGRNALSLSWPHAFLGKGVLLAHAIEPQQSNIEALRSYCDRLVDEEGRVRQPLVRLDQTLNGEVLLGLAGITGDERYMRAADAMASYLLLREHDEGTLSYRPGGWWHHLRFVDTLGMICPFLAQYGTTRKSDAAVRLAVRQLEEFGAYGIEPRTGLPFHGYSTHVGNVPFGVVGWGRGVGWFCVGLVDTVSWLPESDPARAGLEAMFRRTANALIAHQCPDGGWGCIITAPSAFDASATAMVGYFLARGLEAEVLDVSVRDSMDRAIDRLKSATRASGVVDFAQGDTMGIGCHSRAFGPGPHVQGLTLALMSVAMRLRVEAGVGGAP